MEQLLVESAVRGTLIAASVGGVLWATRLRAPALLHAMWTCVVIAMLLLPLWTLWGPKASMQVLPQQQSASAVVIEAPAPLAPVSTSRVEGTPSPLHLRHVAPTVSSGIGEMSSRSSMAWSPVSYSCDSPLAR